MSRNASETRRTTDSEIRFKNMTLSQKLGHIGKACIFIITFGFAFPNIFID